MMYFGHVSIPIHVYHVSDCCHLGIDSLKLRISVASVTVSEGTCIVENDVINRINCVWPFENLFILLVLLQPAPPMQAKVHLLEWDGRRMTEEEAIAEEQAASSDIERIYYPPPRYGETPSIII